MSIDLQQPLGGVESADIALDEFRATQEECSEFFGDLFDQLQILSLELFARHKCLEISTQQKSEDDETILGVREEFQRSIGKLQELHGQLHADRQETHHGWAEILAGYQQFFDGLADLREIREGLRQIAGEFSGIKEDVRRERTDLHELYAKVERQLSLLSSVTAELAAAQARPANDPQIAEVLEHARQQQGEWLQQRAALEAELEAMRRRAAEQAEILSEQKRLAGQQQAELAGELKRLRCLLETLGNQVRGEPVAAGEIAKPPDDNAVLRSVFAQFEMLQRDIHLRRNKRNHAANPDGNIMPGS